MKSFWWVSKKLCSVYEMILKLEKGGWFGGIIWSQLERGLKTNWMDSRLWRAAFYIFLSSSCMSICSLARRRRRAGQMWAELAHCSYYGYAACSPTLCVFHIRSCWEQEQLLSSSDLSFSCRFKVANLSSFLDFILLGEVGLIALEIIFGIDKCLCLFCIVLGAWTISKRNLDVCSLDARMQTLTFGDCMLTIKKLAG